MFQMWQYTGRATDIGVSGANLEKELKNTKISRLKYLTISALRRGIRPDQA
jgi:hypothetical protein